MKFLIKKNIINTWNGKNWFRERSWRNMMKNQATKWLVKYIEDNQVSIVHLEKTLHIPIEKLYPDTKKWLDADEFLKLCAYLNIDPKEIPMN